MSAVINMLDAKTSLSRLVHELESGTAREFIIARNGKPAARLVPLGAGEIDRKRRIGAAKGRFRVPANIDRANEEVRGLLEGA